MGFLRIGFKRSYTAALALGTQTNGSFLVLFFKKDQRAGLVGRPRATKGKKALLFEKRSKNFYSTER
jgi:hypothetical protein